jgi:hypothetical protein
MLRIIPWKVDRPGPDSIFIHNFMLICFLAFTLYPGLAETWIFEAPAANPHEKPYSLIRARTQSSPGHYIIHDYGYFLTTFNAAYLWHGCWFLQCVLPRIC